MKGPVLNGIRRFTPVVGGALSRPRWPRLWNVFSFVLLSIVAGPDACLTAIAGGGIQAAAAQSPATVPKSAWVYVLDNNKGMSTSQVLLLDTEAGRVVRTFAAGRTPEMALSPDGKRLYIVSRLGRHTDDTLLVFDTATGNVLHQETLADRALYKIRPGRPTITVSPDGRWLYIIKMRSTPGPPQRDEYTIATYDAERGSFLPVEAPIPDCGMGQFLQASNNGQLHVLCPTAHSVYSFQVTPQGLGSNPLTLRLPPGPRYVYLSGLQTTDSETPVHPSISGGALSPDGRTLTIVMSYLLILEIDARQKTILRTARGPSDRWSRFLVTAASTNGTKLYVPVGLIAKRGEFGGVTDEILVIDTKSLQQIGMITTSRPFWSFAISDDGRYLFAISPEDRSLTVIDTSTYREIRTIQGTGVTPSRVAVAP